ncbi:MAG: pitrilysin family protein [Acidobacteriota bacterium]
MRVSKSFAFLLVLISLSGSVLFAQSTDKLPQIKVTQYKLKNGLTVLLHRDTSTPIVAVGAFYHVGSKNEAPGRTGFAHLFEHMMFQGSGNYVDGWRGVDELGGNVNGTTNEDRTWYFEAIPSNFLERTLYLEADRMGNLLTAMDQAKLDNQRDVVKNERRFRVDNVPYGQSEERTIDVMYPEGHPYHHSVIGSMADLSAASLDDVKSFFRQYYVPNNAYLILSGDFNESQAKGWIEKYFGPIKAGAAITRPDVKQPQLSSIVRKQYEDPFANLSRVDLVWEGIRQYDPDEAALDVLSGILSTGRGSRLQSAIIFGKDPIAQQVFARNGTKEIGGLYQIIAVARQGKSLDDVEKAINTEIERIKKDGVTQDEISRVVNAREAQSIFGLETDLGTANRIVDYAAYLNNPNYFQEDLDRYLKVTPEDVKRVADKYLIANHLVLNFVPSKTPPPPAQADKPASTETKKKNDVLIAKQDAALPKGAPNPKFTLPATEKTTLSNGLNVWIVEKHKLPVVSMDLVINAGGSLDPADRAGMASLTASMLNQGTKTRSALEIANGLQSIGSNVAANATWDSSGVSARTITKNLDKTLDYFGDLVCHPTFPGQEFNQLRGRVMGAFRQRKASNTAVAAVVYDRVLYGNQAYGHQLTGDEKSVQALNRDDLAKFYDNYYRPNNSTLIVVGDVTLSTLKPKLERALADWKSGGTPPAKITEQTMMAKPGIYIVDKPGAAQSSVSIGQVGVDRDNPDYYAVQVMNSILGGGGTARLFMNLREDKGYTYGAYSRFTYRRAAGPFSASGEIQTISTKEAVQEFVKELSGIRGSRPVTPQELEVNKQSFIRRFPSQFETTGGISNNLVTLVTYGLPETYFNDYISKVNAVTIDDVNRVANKYLDPSKMAIVIVGDRKVIEPHLTELGMPITIVDTEGNPVSE